VELTCQHCRRLPATRPRHLCRRCWACVAVRLSYPTRGGRTDRRGLGQDNAEPPPCPAPTAILPGPAKVAVLATRAAAGVSLWHPCDNGGEE